jgi:acyl-CoA synthetase (AMP-forming)/AMP-acid ligase II
LKDLLSQSKPRWLIVPGADKSCDYPALARTVGGDIGCKVIVLDEEWPRGDVSELPAPPKPEEGSEVRWIYCTSGTTSGPKAVLHTDSSLMAGGHGLALSLEVHEGDVGSIAYPYAHIGGTMYLVILMEVGMSAVLIERFDPVTTAAAFRRYGVTVTGGSTTHYQAWLNLQAANPTQKQMPELRLLSGGGASKPSKLYFDSLQVLGVPIVHSYGMTESPLVTSNTPATSEHNLAHSDGKPVAGMEVRIKRSDGSFAEQGETGEIVIRGACVCKGYLNPEQTREAFDEEGFYHTGDVGSFDEEGYLSLSGRLKDIIIRKGENISAREIEEMLMDFPGVRAVAVIGLPDEERGERVCAVLEYEGDDLSLGDITRFLGQKGLMKQKLPEQLELIDRIPRSEALGKVSKKELQRLYGG